MYFGYRLIRGVASLDSVAGHNESLAPLRIGGSDLGSRLLGWVALLFAWFLFASSGRLQGGGETPAVEK